MKPHAELKPDFSAVMTQHIWTVIGKNGEAGGMSYVNTVYRPGTGLEVWGPASLPDTSLEFN